ncbi:hypothetical protein [Baekduia sp. Peel2402]|uniref:hypothetical protein n=1 Tax=Baekduia sp. Peel2402 TaxID=3458296 RepID=UPI00403E98A8
MHYYRVSPPGDFLLHRATDWTPFAAAAGRLACEPGLDVSDDYRALCEGAAVALAAFADRLGFTVGDTAPSLEELYIVSLPFGPCVYAAQHFGGGDLFLASRAEIGWLPSAGDGPQPISGPHEAVAARQ